MKKLLLILIALPMIGFGQGWTKTFETKHQSYGRSVQQTTDGGYIITGATNSIGGDSMNVYLLKTDASGIEQWTKTFGGTDDRGNSVQQTADGGYIIVGETSSFGNGSIDVYLIKTDGSGIEQWTKTFGGTDNDYGNSVQQTTDGGYIITGITDTNITGMTERYFYLLKTDASGIEQWTKTFFWLGYNGVGNSVQQTTDGGYIITGEAITSYGGYANVYLIKTDANGIEQWSKDFSGGNWNDIGYSVQQTTDGGYIVTGVTQEFKGQPLVLGDGYGDVYLLKTDGNGIEQWAKTYGAGQELGKSVQQTTDGGYIITGITNTFSVNGNGNVYLLKTDGNGAEQWSRAFVGEGSSFGNSVQQTSDGGYIITGTTCNNCSSQDSSFVYLIKTNAQGIATSTFNIPTPNSNRKLEKTVDMLGKQTKPQTNIPFIEIYDDGTVEKRIVIE